MKLGREGGRARVYIRVSVDVDRQLYAVNTRSTGGDFFLSARGNFLGFHFCDKSVVQVISQLGPFIADMAGDPRDFPSVYFEAFSFFQEDQEDWIAQSQWTTSVYPFLSFC